MAANSVLILLVALTCLLQPALQQLLRWEEEERRNFGRSAKAFIAQAIYPRAFRHMAKTFSIKCSGRREAPYGITMRTFEMVECRCNPLYCTGNCHDSHEPVLGECQYAARLDETATIKENFLGLICYERRSNILNKGISEEEICKTWRYPTSGIPQFRIPGYLKSPAAELYAYFPPQMEKRTNEPFILENDWPKNEHERTGFGGVGAHEKLGPNSVLYIVVTRQKRDDFEVIAEQTGGTAFLPQYIPQDGNAGELFARESAKQLRDEVGGTCSDDELLKIVEAKRLIHGGYLKDNLNTDNAWMEGFIIHLPDPDGNCFPLSSVAQSGRYSWLNLPMIGDGIDDYLSPMIKPLLANYK